MLPGAAAMAPATSGPQLRHMSAMSFMQQAGAAVPMAVTPMSAVVPSANPHSHLLTAPPPGSHLHHMHSARGGRN
jgi:hypothetical protein